MIAAWCCQKYHINWHIHKFMLKSVVWLILYSNNIYYNYRSGVDVSCCLLCRCFMLSMFHAVFVVDVSCCRCFMLSQLWIINVLVSINHNLDRKQFMLYYTKITQNYLTSFKFTQMLINSKSQSCFLKCDLINANGAPSDFLMVLNYCRFHLMQFWMPFFI